jgi:16S rRNA (guanine527-N7)-methyltransferase
MKIDLDNDKRFSHLSADQRIKLADYLQLLIKWNKVYNLTAIKDPSQMVTHHLLDSLSIEPYLHGDRLIDVGTGAGLPGIPLAITHPDKQFVLLDSNVKKTRFCQQAAAELGLKNVMVVHSRVQDYQPDVRFSSVISRAYAVLSDMITSCQHLLAEDGAYLAMKSQAAEQELTALSTRFHYEMKPLDIAGLTAARCLVVIRYDMLSEE